MPTGAPAATLDALASPALIICGSLHSMARSQIGAVCAADLATAVTVTAGEVGPATTALGAEQRHAVVQRIRSLLNVGRSVVLAPEPPSRRPDDVSRRALERALADVAGRSGHRGPAASGGVMGGETR
jgi:hypothetical protein